MPKPQEHVYSPPDAVDIPVIHEDPYFIVVDKPAGLLSVPGRGENKRDCLLLRLEGAFSNLQIVHRLDMDTSGLMVLARGKPAQAELGRQFQNRQVQKTYFAQVRGRPVNDVGIVELPLISDWPNRPLQKVDHVHGKQALTRYKVVDFDDIELSSRIQLEPLTGRTHQLRVHMQQLGHPILGDRLYAEPEIASLRPRLCLHAGELVFRHPQSGESLKFVAETPF